MEKKSFTAVISKNYLDAKQSDVLAPLPEALYNPVAVGKVMREGQPSAMRCSSCSHGEELST